MKTAPITVITGQDGSYLAELLLAKEYVVCGFHHGCEDLRPHRTFVVFSGEEGCGMPGGRAAGARERRHVVLCTQRRERRRRTAHGDGIPGALSGETRVALEIQPKVSDRLVNSGPFLDTWATKP